jgi:hypothetical protein
MDAHGRCSALPWSTAHQLGRLAVGGLNPWQELPYVVVIDLMHHDRPMWLVHDNSLLGPTDNDLDVQQEQKQYGEVLGPLASLFSPTTFDLALVLPRLDQWIGMMDSIT